MKAFIFEYLVMIGLPVMMFISIRSILMFIEEGMKDETKKSVNKNQREF